MPHFAGEAVVAGEKDAVDHHAHADAGAHVEHDEAVQLAGLAVDVLGQAQGVGVVHQHAIGADAPARDPARAACRFRKGKLAARRISC